MAKHELRTPEGAPVQVETGVGRIVALIEKGTRNVQVHIDAEHLRQPVTGWVDKQGPVWDRVQHAKQTEARIWYRVDLHRSRSASEPIDTPLGQLPIESKVRDLVRIERPGEAPPDNAIGLDPMLNQASGRADEGNSATGSSVPAAQATDGRAARNQTPGHPPAAAGPVTQQQPAAPAQPPAQAPAQQRPAPHPVLNPSPRPASAPPIPGPRLTAATLQALGEVVAAIRAEADPDWVTDVCDSAMTTGCTREQILHVLARAREHQDSGLPSTIAELPPAQYPTQPGHQGQQGQQGQHGHQQQDRAASALAAQRDPDRIGERRPAPADVGPPGGEAPRDPQRPLASAHNGMSRRVGSSYNSTRGNVTVDGKPYDVSNMDGTTNWASYAVDAVMDLVVLASAQRMTRIRNLNHQDPDTWEIRNPTAREVDDLARTLLTMTDRVQVHLRGGNRPDRMGASHKVARRAVKEGMAVMAIPWGEPAPVMARWVEEVVSYASVLVDVTAGIHERRPALRELEHDSAQHGTQDGVHDGNTPGSTGAPRGH